MRKISLVLATIVVLLFLSLIPGGASAASLSKNGEPTDDFVTEHIAWCKPSAHGPLKVLFIVPRMGAREVVETCQRFDIQRDVVFTLNWDAFAYNGSMGQWPDADEKATTDILRAKLAKDYDLIVIGHIKWDILPDWARATILEKVQNGTGLVCRIRGKMPQEIVKALESNPVDGPASFSGYPFPGLPLFSRFETLEAFRDNFFRFCQLGKGRVCVIDKFPFNKDQINKTIQVLTPECTSEVPDLYWTHYDYYQALLGHLFAWAAKGEPEIRVRVPEEILRLALDRKNMSTVRFTVESSVDAEFDLRFVLRESEYGDILASSMKKSVYFKKGNNVNIASFPVQNIPAGAYFADLWFLRQGKTVNYGSVFMTITSATAIDKLELSKTFFSQKEPVQGKVILKNFASDEKVIVRQKDNYGRVVAEETFPAAGGKIDFQLKPSSSLTILQTVEAELLQGQNIVDRKRQRFTYSDIVLSVTDVPALMGQSYEGNTYLNIALAQSCFQQGFDGTLIFGNVDTNRLQAYSNLLANLSFSPMVYGRGMKTAKTNFTVGCAHDNLPNRVEHGLARNPCLNDPEYQNAAQLVYSDGAQFWKQFSPSFYNLGDECMFSPHGSKDDLCFSDFCLADFRKFVQKEYGSIANLNTEYGTNYTSFDQVLPVSLDQLKDNPQLAPIWIDHRRHMDTVWANYLDSAGQSIRSEAPGAMVGYEGSGDSGHGSALGALTATDYGKLGHAMNANLPYYWPFQTDALRDFSEPGSMIGGGWVGSYPQMWRGGHDPVTETWWVWNGLFRGANTIHIYLGLGNWNDSTIAPDFSFFDWFRDGIIAQMKIIKAGAGKLVVSAQREDDGTAVLYSPPSMLLSSITQGMPDFWESACGTPIIMQEALQQYRLVAEPEVENGVLRTGKYRVLYLPCALALSDKETAEILAFAKNGGIVLADLRPGVADQHGKTREKGGLDQLFGIQQTVAASTMTAKVEIVNSVISGLDLGVTSPMPALRLDSSLKLSGGKSLGQAGDIPAIIVNDYGKGKGILLNMCLVDYLRVPKDSTGRFTSIEAAEKTGLLLRGLLNLSSVKPAVTLDRFVPGMRVHRLASGNLKLAGLVWDAQPFLPAADVLEPFAENNPERAKQAQTEMERINARKETVTMKLPAKSHIYDVFQGKYEGYTDSVTREMSPGKVCLFALLPYQASALNVKPTIENGKSGRELVIAASLQGATKPSTQIFHIRLLGPDGTEVGCYSSNQPVTDGQLKYRLPLALNENLGKWKVTVIDAATGTVGSAEFEVSRLPEGR